MLALPESTDTAAMPLWYVAKASATIFMLIESLRSDRRVLGSVSLDLEKGTFGLVRAARIDNDKPI